MADAQSARQQIIDKIKDSSNILVTVSKDPSVDALSAALGLTIMLNKLKKHATAVVSGAIPPAITFLDPEKTFENTVDSLRDFIIALDKEKADHLRYKVEGDVVKIFITPYRTTITDKDLDFSQGDYNVELVLALGVTDETHLDAALEAHGKILHDATVATIGADGGEPSKLGSIDWHDESASSLSEMLVSMSEAIKGDTPLLDEQTSTALLTGIVAATDRFSNNRTSSKVMTMSAQLMAAGANQQLIAAKLQEANEIGPEAHKIDSQNSDGTTDLSEDTSTKVDKAAAPEEAAGEPADDPSIGILAVSHEKEGTLDEVAKQVQTEEAEKASERANDALDNTATQTAASNTSAAAQAAEDKLAEELRISVPGSGEPAMGGTLNATTELAAEDRRREEEDDRNRTILTHGESGHVDGGNSASSAPAFNANSQSGTDEQPIVDPFITSPIPAPSEAPQPESTLPSVSDVPVQGQTLADIDAQARQPHEDARAAVDAALGAAPSESPVNPVGLPPMPDFSTLPPPPPPLPPMPSAPSDQPSGQPTGAVPPEKLADIFSTPPAGAPDAPPVAPPSNDPGQFKIPGQS